MRYMLAHRLPRLGAGLVVALGLVVGLTSPTTSLAQSAPGLFVVRYYGTVTIDNAPAPVDTTVTVLGSSGGNASTVCGETKTRDAQGSYSVDIKPTAGDCVRRTSRDPAPTHIFLVNGVNVVSVGTSSHVLNDPTSLRKTENRNLRATAAAAVAPPAPAGPTTPDASTTLPPGQPAPSNDPAAQPGGLPDGTNSWPDTQPGATNPVPGAQPDGTNPWPDTQPGANPAPGTQPGGPAPNPAAPPQLTGTGHGPYNSTVQTFSDGTRRTTFPGGAVLTQRPDGSGTIQFPQGTDRLQPGDHVVYSGGGMVEVYDQQGTLIVRFHAQGTLGPIYDISDQR